MKKTEEDEEYNGTCEYFLKDLTGMHIKKKWRKMNMLNNKKFFYKAKRTDTGEWVEGRVGSSQSVENGVEKTTYFESYVGDKCPYANWESCVVLTDTIAPL